MYERQGDELGETAAALLQVEGDDEVTGLVQRLLDRAEHDGDVRRQANTVRCLMGVEPFLGVDLVRTQDGADAVVEDLGRRSGERTQSGAIRRRRY